MVEGIWMTRCYERDYSDAVGIRLGLGVRRIAVQSEPSSARSANETTFHLETAESIIDISLRQSFQAIHKKTLSSGSNAAPLVCIKPHMTNMVSSNGSLYLGQGEIDSKR